MQTADQSITESFSYPIANNEREVWNKILHIGGEKGWYYATSLWKIRGKVDHLIGGPGYRKGRKNSDMLEEGDQIDFWRILKLDRDFFTIELQAEMKLPGKVFLEWTVTETKLIQKVTFLPKGIRGKAYWYLVKPFHYWIFFRMGKEISKG